jgi:hypothetical protein
MSACPTWVFRYRRLIAAGYDSRLKDRNLGRVPPTTRAALYQLV